MFLKPFSFTSARDPRVSQPLCTKQKKSRSRQRFVSTIVCLHIRQSVVRWPPSFSTSLPNDRSKRVAVPSGGGNDRYRCHFNCVTQRPPNWTVLALPYAQDVEGIAPDAHRSCLKFCAKYVIVGGGVGLYSLSIGNARRYWYSLHPWPASVDVCLQVSSSTLFPVDQGSIP